jgi:Tn3 transposase DDE domain
MPRIRRWRKLNLYRSERSEYYSRRDPLFSGTVNWSLIREHYDLFMQLSVAIQSGALAPPPYSPGSIATAEDALQS